MFKDSRLFLCLLFLIGHQPAFAQFFSLVNTFRDSVSSITVLRVDDNRTKLISGDSSGYLCFHDLNSGAFIKKIKVHSAPVQTISFNSNGRLLISSTADGEIKIFDFAQDRIIQSIYSPDYTGNRFVLFSIADGFIYFNGHNRLYKTRSDLTQPVMKTLEEREELYDAVITSDRNSLIYTTGNTLKVMDTRTDIVKQELSTGALAIERLSLVRDDLLATWSKDGTINFWKYQLGQLSGTPEFWFKAGEPTQMNFSPDGNWMLSGYIGNWARVWKPFEKIVFQELFGHQSTVTSCVFGPDTNMIYTGSKDGSIKQWKKNPTQKLPVAFVPQVQPIQEPELKKPEQDSAPLLIPLVEMGETNIPKTIQGRKIGHHETIEIHDDSLTIYVYDNSFIDGDTMSLFFNGEWILDHYGVTKQKKAITLKFRKNTNNYLVLFANNLGKTPPNTAAVTFKEGNSIRFFRLESDLHSCSALNFLYRK